MLLSFSFFKSSLYKTDISDSDSIAIAFSLASDFDSIFALFTSNNVRECMNLSVCSFYFLNFLSVPVNTES